MEKGVKEEIIEYASRYGDIFIAGYCHFRCPVCGKAFIIPIPTDMENRIKQLNALEIISFPCEHCHYGMVSFIKGITSIYNQFGTVFVM